MKSKQELRRDLKLKVAELSRPEYDILSRKLSENLEKLLRKYKVLEEKKALGVFAPIEREPEWFLAWPKEYHGLTAYPALEGEEMVFKSTSLDELEEGRGFGKGVLHPKASSLVVQPSWVITPGLGFSSTGKRLGRGKGFYDRYFEKHQAVKVGVAFHLQLEEDLPWEAHDVLMDFVVTDKDIFEIKK